MSEFHLTVIGVVQLHIHLFRLPITRFSLIGPTSISTRSSSWICTSAWICTPSQITALGPIVSPHPIPSPLDRQQHPPHPRQIKTNSLTRLYRYHSSHRRAATRVMLRLSSRGLRTKRRSGRGGKLRAESSRASGHGASGSSQEPA